MGDIAQICSHCGSDQTETLVRTVHCLVCNRHTTYAAMAETPQPTHRRED